jgi:antitoxin (DNA-binding transcriptional repressor) of toxin-antitoxin stability system
MKTIGAKELRLNLDQILDRVLGGEEILISHRFKGPVRLSPLYRPDSHLKNNDHAGLRAFDAAPKLANPFNPGASVKELYDQSITKKYIG